MSLSSSRRTSGFTLVEMTIVLGIAGILFGGLWKMLSAGNAQMRDQATANQQLQLASAVSNYLQSSGDDLSSLTGGGQKFLKNLPANGGTAALDLPDGGANCSGTDAKGFCAFLPAGFTSVTKNPYGQTYLIRVKRDNTNLNEIPKTYSFMILTTGGKAIPDASGGRISAAMGGDGGFVYNSDICNADFAAYACGAYGAWTAKPVNDYGFLASVSGHVASRSYPSSQSMGSGDVWLARNLLSSDSANRIYNTMTTTLYLGGQNADFATFNGTTGGTMFVRNGTIDLGTNGQLVGSAGIGGVSGGGGTITLNGNMSTVAGVPTNSLLQVSSPCQKANLADNTCNYVASINGSLTVRDYAYAAIGLFSGQFIYQSSDLRLKSNIEPLSNAIDNIMKLKPVSFVYKSNGHAGLGLIAQDAEKIYPQIVTEGPDGMKGISYEALIAPLIQSVQELKNENDALRKELKEQKAQQAKLEAEVGKLRQRK